MVPTIPFDLFFSVFAGLCFATAAMVQFREGRSPWGRELLAVVSFEGIVVWPTSIYFYLVHPDWSWMYFVDPARLPAGVLALVLGAHLVALLGGYLGGWMLIRRRGDKAAVLAVAGGAVLLSLVALFTRARLFRYGTYAGFHHGQTQPLSEVKLFWVLGPIAVGVLVSAVAVGWTLFSQGRRSGGRPAPSSAGRDDPATS